VKTITVVKGSKSYALFCTYFFLRVKIISLTNLAYRYQQPVAGLRNWKKGTVRKQSTRSISSVSNCSNWIVGVTTIYARRTSGNPEKKQISVGLTCTQLKLLNTQRLFPCFHARNCTLENGLFEPLIIISMSLVFTSTHYLSPGAYPTRNVRYAT